MSEDGFLSRWSSRKRSSRRGRASPVADPVAVADPPAPELAVEEEGAASAAGLGNGDGQGRPLALRPEENLEDPSPERLREQAEAAGLPAIEELDADSDYSAFLARGVPEALKRAALRKLWRSNPVFANLDGLNDYDLDYNVVDRVLNLAEAGAKVVKSLTSEETPASRTADVQGPSSNEDGATADGAETEATETSDAVPGDGDEPRDNGREPRPEA